MNSLRTGAMVVSWEIDTMRYTRRLSHLTYIKRVLLDQAGFLLDILNSSNIWLVFALHWPWKASRIVSTLAGECLALFELLNHTGKITDSVQLTQQEFIQSALRWAPACQCPGVTKFQSGVFEKRFFFFQFVNIKESERAQCRTVNWLLHAIRRWKSCCFSGLRLWITSLGKEGNWRREVAW